MGLRSMLIPGDSFHRYADATGGIMPAMSSPGQEFALLDINLLVDSIPALIHTARPDGYLDYFNKPWLEYLGVTLDEVTGWNWTAYVHPEDVEGIVAKWRACLATGEIFEYETRVRRANGDFRWMFHRKVPLRDTNGNIVKWYGSSLDIDERKTAEGALRSSEAYLAEAQKLSHTGSFGWKPDTGEIVWSDETYRIFEYDRAVKPTIDSVVQRVHPEDRADFQKVSGGASQGATDFEHAYRLLLLDGRVKYVHAIAHAVQNASGDREFIGAVTDITERKTNEDKIRRLVEAGILGIFFANVEGEIVEANQAFLQMLQYSRQDLASGRLRWADITPAEWRERDERSLTEFLATGVFQAHEKEYFRKDGSRVPVLVGGARMQSPNEGVVFALDLSEQKRAEERIRRSESYLAEAQRLSHTGSWAWSPGQDIRYWSEECYRVLGFDPRDGLPPIEQLIERIHPDDQPAFRESVRRAKHKKSDEQVDYRIVHPDGSVRDIHSIGHPVFSPSGELIEFTGTVIDVTERKRAEEELNRAHAEFAHVARVTTLNTLTASIAHELNQPLSGIITNASTCLRMLEGDPPNVDGARETARRIIRDGNRASDVISRLRVLFSKKEFTLEPLDLNEATREMIALSLSDLQRNRVILRSELTEDLPLVIGDRVQLQQVILNLLRNASDAMLGVDGRPKELLIKTERDQGLRVRLSVIDAGVGITPEAADKLFEAFYTTKTDGMGIGLSVSRSIIERHHGRLWAEANAGPGATFSFSVPCDPGEATDVAVQ
jgi:PAS domain S-box-containing protein